MSIAHTAEPPPKAVTADRPASAAPPERRRPPMSRLAVWGALCAVPAAPLGIVLSALALRDVARRLARGRGLATTGLVVSILVTLLSGALAVVLRVVAPLAVGLSATAARESPEQRSWDPTLHDEKITSCRHERGEPFARVGWRVSDVVESPRTTMLLIDVLDASGGVLGNSSVDLGRRVAGTRTGVLRVPMKPYDVIAACDLATADFY